MAGMQLLPLQPAQPAPLPGMSCSGHHLHFYLSRQSWLHVTSHTPPPPPPPPACALPQHFVQQMSTVPGMPLLLLRLRPLQAIQVLHNIVIGLHRQNPAFAPVCLCLGSHQQSTVNTACLLI